MSTRKINFYLGALTGASDHQGLLAQANKLTRMQQTFMEIAPPQLAKLCALGQLSEGDLSGGDDVGAEGTSIGVKLDTFGTESRLKCTTQHQVFGRTDVQWATFG